MEMKWLYIFLSIAIVALSISTVLESKISDDIAKSGLEQCPKRGSGTVSEAIWVKSCVEYTNSIKE